MIWISLDKLWSSVTLTQSCYHNISGGGGGGGLLGYHDLAGNYNVLSVLVSDQSTASYIINSYYVVQLAS